MSVPDKDTAPPTPYQAAVLQSKRYEDAIEKVRGRADVSAKTFAGLGTTALGVVSLSKITDFFPLPPTPRAIFWVVVTLSGLALLGFALALFISRVWRVSEPILTKIDPAEMTLKRGERSLVEEAYADHAAANGFDNWADYVAEGKRLNGQDAAAFRAGIRVAQARASILVIRRRAAAAATGLGTWIAAILFLLGLVALGSGSDWLAAERDDARIALAKSCGDAQVAIANAKLPSAGLLPAICGSVAQEGSGTASPSMIQERAATASALATQWRDCIARTKQPADEAACAPTLHLLQQLATNG